MLFKAELKYLKSRLKSVIERGSLQHLIARGLVGDNVKWLQ
jgi:hypothetical protein